MNKEQNISKTFNIPICPECKSNDIQEQSGFASQVSDDEKIQKPNIIPNECIDCGHKWLNKISKQ